jgi:hypothetical protein
MKKQAVRNPARLALRDRRGNFPTWLGKRTVNSVPSNFVPFFSHLALISVELSQDDHLSTPIVRFQKTDTDQNPVDDGQPEAIG